MSGAPTRVADGAPNGATDAATRQANDAPTGAKGRADAETRRRVLHRLRRASGQLTAVIGAVEQGRPCRELVTQLAAVSSAVDRAGFVIIGNALKDCLADPEAALAQDGTTTEELEKLFLMLA